jgi:hypothetical protein
LLTDHNPDSTLLKWVKRYKEIKNDLIKLFEKNTSLILNLAHYNTLSGKLSDLREMRLNIGLDEKMISRVSDLG